MTSEGQRGGGPRSLRVLVSDERGRAAPSLARWLTRIAPARARGTIGVAIVSDARMRSLNRVYRGRDYATDVLSFPEEQCPRSPIATIKFPSSGSGSRRERFLGEIVIARGVAGRQARDAGHPPRTEFRILALHGLLHLLGYDHETDNGRMRRLEHALRRKGGLREGLIERSGTRA